MKMLKYDNKNVCPLTDEILSYIYGEISGGAERDFETHLAGCTICTDEFAAVSDSRFSVYEWKKEAFDPLPTPRIAIPASAGRERVGIFTAVKAWAEGFSVPIAVAAGLVLCIGIGLIVLGRMGNSGGQVAVNPAAPVTKTEPASSQEILATSETNPSNVEPKRVEPPATRTPRPVMASSVQPKRTVKHMTLEAQKTPEVVTPRRLQQLQKAPALTAYQESEDNSLRLSDLFEEVGG